MDSPIRIWLHGAFVGAVLAFLVVAIRVVWRGNKHERSRNG